jgi:2,3-bisphosphoglycerate-independent phosphoglycerate mutase
MGEREKPPLILGRPFLKTVGANIDVGKGEIKFDCNGERSSFNFRPRLEVCNMTEIKYVPPHHRVATLETRKKEEPKKKEVKRVKEVVASVKTMEQKQPVKTKKMTKPESNPVPKMVQKWVPKIATLAKSIDLK